MRRYILGLTAVLLSLLILLCPALAEEQLLANGTLDEMKNGQPEGWRREMWFTDDGVSTLEADPYGYEGGCVMVYNASRNDARYAQTVQVEPDTLYRLTALIRAEGIDPNSESGANISIADTFAQSEPLYDTAGEWQQVELYGVTGSNQTELTVFLRVGGYGAECAGRAWFDSITMDIADDFPPEDIVVEDFAPIGSGSDDDYDDDDEGDTATEPERYTPGWLLLACVSVLVIIAGMKKYPRLPEDERVNGRLMVLLVAVGVLVRVILAVIVPGYRTDINCFSAWANQMASSGPFRFYAEVSWCDYPPLYMLLLWPIGLLTRLLGLTYGTGVQLLLVKLWPIVFDAVLACVIYRRCRRLTGSRCALLLAGLFLLNPAVLADSAAWGQIDSLLALLIALCVLDVCDGRYVRGLVWYALALLAKPQALLFGPIGLIYVVMERVRAHRAGEPDARRRTTELLIGIAAALGVMYLTAFVSVFGMCTGPVEHLVRPVTWLIEQYTGATGGYRYVTVNALNLYCLLGLNWAHADTNRVVMMIAWGLLWLSVAYCAVLCVLRKHSWDLALIGAAMVLLMTVFGPMMHERYLYPALVLLILAYGYSRDRRVLGCATVLTATLFMNVVLVLQGGMGEGNYGHLQGSETWLNAALSMINVGLALYTAWVALDVCVRDRVDTLPIPEPEPLSLRKEDGDWRLGLKRTEVLVMAAVTLVYGVVAFVNLGDTRAPQTYWQSGSADERITLDLGETMSFRMTYYGNICNTNFTVELSNDGETWTEPVYADYAQGQIFRWLWFVPCDEDNDRLYETTEPTEDGSAYIAYTGWEDEDYPYQTARYVRLTSVSAGLKLCEVGFLDHDGNVLPIASVEQAGENCITKAELLVDEQSVVPSTPSYLNSTYFDEIYHARTAYEHLHGMSTYEWTHPPLGKVLIMVGIGIFGMTPFGWRFSGTLIGVLMLPLMYLLVKQLTKSRRASTVAMLLLALDSMHFTQTRIATIDSFAVFWIMAMYLLMIRFCQMPWSTGKQFRRSLVTLGACGITMGIAWATKWIGLYASAGLAVLLFWTLFRRVAESRSLPRANDAPAMLPMILKTLGFCCVFFVVVPVLIYYLSYFWHLRSSGVVTFADMFSGTHVKTIVELQRSIFRYHAGLGSDTHYFRSPWYQWPIIWWPMWYYSGASYVPYEIVSSISCMGNPAVWWFGLGALIFVILYIVCSRRAPRTYVTVLIAFCSQYLPWVLVPRSTFIYHYFASVPFIIICSVLALEKLGEKDRRTARIVTIVLLAAAAVLFIMFYPLESGMPVARSYAMLLRWFKWYNFNL